MSYGAAQTFFPAEELVVGELAHRGVGLAERVHLVEEAREAGWVRLTNGLESFLAKPCGRERLAGVPHRRIGRNDDEETAS